MSTHTVTDNRRHMKDANSDMQPGKDLVDYAKAYAQEKPEVVAMWCFGVGFILGWKLKPW